MLELPPALIQTLNILLIVLTDVSSALFKPLALPVQRLSQILLEGANQLSMFLSTLISLFISLSDLFIALRYAFIGASADRVVVRAVRVKLVLSHIGALLAELVNVLGLISVHN